MAKMVKREVYYFDEPGERNTQLVLEAVSHRLEAGGIRKVIIASTSGETAAKFARKLKDKAELICVSEAPYRREWDEEWPCLKQEFREELERLRVAIVDRAPYVFHDSVLEAARWTSIFPERLVKETLYCFGQGMKVAVEVALMAASCGYAIPYEDVIGVGGSGKGADTAIVLRATYPASLFDKDSGKRLEIKEVIALCLLPRSGGNRPELVVTQRQWRQNITHRYWNYLFSLVIVLAIFCCSCAKPATIPAPIPSPEQENTVKLPEPRYDSDVSLEQSLLQRRSIRTYTGEPLTLQEVSQLLWAAQGITDPRGFRTAPSAGALYPLEVYVVAGDVQGLTLGVYRYEPEQHQLIRVIDGDKRDSLADAALTQPWVKEGAVVFVFTAVYERTTAKYDDRGIRYVHIEVGHAAQNLCLQATAMGLGAVTVGAFHDEAVAELLNLPQDEQPLYIIPVGRKQ